VRITVTSVIVGSALIRLAGAMVCSECFAAAAASVYDIGVGLD
jgi:hypothetical protein